MTKKALKDLLEAVDLAIYSGDWRVDGACDPDSAIQRARETLAQPEHEPSYWLGYGLQAHTEKPFEGATPVYTTPPQRKPLTDEEIGAILEGVNAYGTRLYTFARAIEVAHGIKENT